MLSPRCLRKGNRGVFPPDSRRCQRCWCGSPPSGIVCVSKPDVVVGLLNTPQVSGVSLAGFFVCVVHCVPSVAADRGPFGLVPVLNSASVGEQMRNRRQRGFFVSNFLMIKCPCCGANVRIDATVTQAFEPSRPPSPKPKKKRDYGRGLSARQTRINGDSYTSGSIRGENYRPVLPSEIPPWEDTDE